MVRAVDGADQRILRVETAREGRASTQNCSVRAGANGRASAGAGALASASGRLCSCPSHWQR